MEQYLLTQSKKKTERNVRTAQCICGFGKLLMPKEEPVDDQGNFDLLAQFHGADLARMEFVRSNVPAVLIAVKMGDDGSYPEISGPGALQALVKSVQRTMGKESPTNLAQAEHLALMSWSAGFRGVKLALQRTKHPELVDAVVLLDSLHTARDVQPGAGRLRDFIKFARRAAAGDAFMYVSYSSIMTKGYASTTESARMLIQKLGGHPLEAQGRGPAGMELKEVFSQGNFHARGYVGSGELDHCAHLLLLPEVVEALHRHWHPD